MSKFATGKRISLSFIGEGKEPNPWKDAWIEVERLELEDVNKLEEIQSSTSLTQDEIKAMKPAERKAKEAELKSKGVDVAKQVYKFVQDRFVGGEAVSRENGSLVPIDKEDIVPKGLPMEIIAHVVQELRSGARTDPNS